MKFFIKDPSPRPGQGPGKTWLQKLSPKEQITAKRITADESHMLDLVDTNTETNSSMSSTG
jgi:hypothetical protein